MKESKYPGYRLPIRDGYAEGAWAAAASNPSIQQSCLLSGTTFVCPTNKNAIVNALAKATKITYGGGADGNPLGSSTPKCQLYIAPTTFVDPPPGDLSDRRPDLLADVRPEQRRAAILET